jgi:hypothetical protein
VLGGRTSSISGDQKIHRWCPQDAGLIKVLRKTIMVQNLLAINRKFLDTEKVLMKRRNENAIKTPQLSW